MSTRRIANELFISPSTIVRFCQKLGFSGYDSFRKKYLEEVKYLDSHFNEIDTNKPFASEDSDWHIANKIGYLYRETVSDTLSLVQFELLEKVKHILTHHDTICIFSAGDAIVPAYNFKNKLVRLGKHVEVFQRGDLAYIAAAQGRPDTCFILISYSGETRLFLVRDENDLQTIKAVYDDLGKEAAMLYSHTYSKGDILLQMGGDVSDEDFALYTAVIDEVVE